MEKKMKTRFMSKNAVTAIVVVLLVAVLGYFVITDGGISDVARAEIQLEAYQAGAQYGFEEAITRLAEMAITCEQVPLRIENETFNVIAVGCLQQAA